MRMMRRRQFLQVAPAALFPAALDSKSLLGPRPAAIQPPDEPGGSAGRDPWRPDGWGWRGQLAVLMPHADVEPDSEFSALAPEGVSVQAMRVRWVGVQGPTGAMTRFGAEAARAFVESPLIDEAVDMLVDTPLARPQAIALCFTGGSYLLGPDATSPSRHGWSGRPAGCP